jgi:hypothetical protein
MTFAPSPSGFSSGRPTPNGSESQRQTTLWAVSVSTRGVSRWSAWTYKRGDHAAYIASRLWFASASR